jgi:hypothetical protein
VVTLVTWHELLDRTVPARHIRAEVDMNAVAKLPKPDKAKRIPKRIVQAVNLLVSGECRYQKDAAAKVGVTPEYLSRALARPSVRAFHAQRAAESIAAPFPRPLRRWSGYWMRTPSMCSVTLR